MSLARLLRFGFVGVLNTGIYYTCYLLLRLSVQYLVAHVCATAIAMVCSYFLNCYITFRIRPHWKTFVLFPLSNAFNFVITTVGLNVSVQWLGVDERIAPLPMAVLAIPLTYLATHYLMLGRWRQAYLDEVAAEQAEA
ncbi:MAG: GtrA family protein [Actinomycetota bacterium]|nr:GtrA family protein [Actinomycetota bacterium]